MKINQQIIASVKQKLTQMLCTLAGVFILLSSATIAGQTFPVNVSLQVTNPAPIYLSNYSDANLLNGPLRTQLVLNDFSITNRQIALRVSVKGQGIALESRPGFTGNIPLFIDGGTPLNVTTAEIAQYFELQNIVGISPQAYANALPEGNYEFCMEVIDVITGLQLSQKTCTNTFVIQNDPPLLVLPFKGEEKDASKIQNIIFQWTPRGVNVTDVDYELSMVEVWNNQVDPQTAFLSSPPIFTVSTNRTSFRYGPDQPLLLSNKRYAWRVQAKAQKGGEPIALFENAGYSEIFWFDYITPCEAPKNISAEVKGIYKANIYWDENLDEITPYIIRYRQANLKDAQWFMARTTEPWATLWDLKEGTTYEYQVSSKCQLGDSEFSEIKSFTTDVTENEETYYNCGITSDIELTNKEPITELYVDEVFTAGDFPVRITELSGSNGRYTGKGVVTIPYLKNVGLNVKFSNVLINNEKQLADGVVITTYDSSLKNILDVDEAIAGVKEVIDEIEDLGDALKGGDKKEVAVDFEIEDVQLNEDKTKIVITGKNGETKEVDYDEEDEYQIAGTDKTFRIDKQGNAEQTGQVAEGGSASPSNTSGVASGPTSSGNGSSVSQVATEAIEIAFREGEGTTYAFDKAEGTFEKETYPKTKNEAGAEVYAFHKAVPNGATDVFYADVKIRNKRIKLDSLIIKTLSGRKIDYVVEAKNTLKITVKGFDGYRKEEAIVTYKIEGGKQQVAANFFIHHLAKPAPIAVNLVPMGGAVITASFKQELQAIYKKIGVEFNLSVMPNYNPDTSVWDKDGNTQLTYDGSGVFKNFPPEFKAINKDYQTTDDYSSKAYYLFVTDLYTSEPLGGFMPKGSQFGYVFVNGSGAEGKGAPAKTAAHELGHGVFGLEHPFKDTKSPNTNTNWLMDYGTDTQFSQVNWATLGNEKLRLYLFQKDEDNEYTDSEYIQKVFQKIRCANINEEKTLDEKYFSKVGENFKGKFQGLSINLSIKREQVRLKRYSEIPIETTKGGPKNSQTKSVAVFDYMGVKFSVFPYNSKKINELQDYLSPINKDEIENDFIEIVNRLEAKKTLNDADIRELKSIASCGAQHFSTKGKFKIIKLIEDSKTYLSEYYEDLILDLLDSYPDDINSYANELLDLFYADKSFLRELFYSIQNNDGIFFANEKNRDRFMEILFGLWVDSKYADSSRYKYLDPSKYFLFDEFYISPPTVVYNGNSWFPRTTYQDPILKTNTIEIQGGRPAEKPVFALEYDYFQPVNVLFVESDTAAKVTNVPVPAIFLAGSIKSDNTEKRIKQIGLTVDIALTASGTGNLFKLRHLSKLRVAGKILYGALEVTSGAADILVNYTDLCQGNEQACAIFREYNTYLQLGMIGTGILKAKFKQTRLNAIDAYKGERAKLIKKYGDEDYRIKELDGHFDIGKLADAGSEISETLRTKIFSKIPTNQADELILELGKNSSLKAAMESGDISSSAWKKISDGIPSFRLDKPTDYLTCLKKMTQYEKGIGGSGTVKYYRVQGGGSGNATSRELLVLEPNGNMSFADKTKELYFSTDNLDHAKYYVDGTGTNINGKLVTKRPPNRPNGTIIEFEVPKWLDDKLKKDAIPQHKSGSNTLNNNSPQIVDYNQPGNPFGIKESWQTLIERNYIKGSVKIIE